MCVYVVRVGAVCENEGIIIIIIIILVGQKRKTTIIYEWGKGSADVEKKRFDYKTLFTHIVRWVLGNRLHKGSRKRALVASKDAAPPVVVLLLQNSHDLASPERQLLWYGSNVRQIGQIETCDFK